LCVSAIPPPVCRGPGGPVAATHAFLSTLRSQQTSMWFWSQTPWPLQPAVVQALLSVSGHGVLSVANVCVCTHTPRSGLVGLTSQPASVHTLPSESVHGVLVFGVHWPVVVSQPPLHSSAPGHVLLM